MSYTAPHDPLQAPEKYLKTPDCAKMANWRRRTFCGMVKVIDEGIADVMHALEETGQANNTIILFSTDNGGAPAVGGFNYPFRGQKSTVYEGGIHNPAFIHVPSALGAPRRGNLYDRTIHISDVAVTLLGLVDRVSGSSTSMLSLMGDFQPHALGFDHTEHLWLGVGSTVFDISNKSDPRTATLLEFDTFFQRAVYLEGDMKLILGNTGRDSYFKEPTGTYYDADERPKFVIEEIMCDMVERLAPNW